MESNSRAKRSSQGSTDTYPKLLGDLNRTEMEALTEILHLNATINLHSIAQAQKLIQDLPKRLRYKRLSLSGLGIKPSGLCELHKPMNADVLQDALRLVHREVTTCFRPFDHYPEHVHSPEADLLVKLRGLKGMWTRPAPSGLVAQYGAWEYQINACAACMLSRVAADENAIGNLRTALISRTRTDKRHKPRRLMSFVDECIRRYDIDKAEAIISLASNYAYGLKEARKACTKASNDVHGGLRFRQEDTVDPVPGFSRLTTNEHPVPERNIAQPTPSSDIEWAVSSFPRTSGSHYSRGVEILFSKNTSEESPLIGDMISQIDDAIEESSMYQFIFQCLSSESDYGTDEDS
ncbi:hypothetical protein N7478_009421 [Penicillium angulare]|uniref:uncharacterized protein n=1 Tax=Penicillium angulare TaxID=116970 RepID=UPI002540FA65|nr:uncharacterized protein N7478_009421 [Penicillium angulare]KAJ5266613.1 hypothetical protein N7478_009421 [Penicillium angulare]